MSDYIGIRCKELRGWLSKNPGSYSKSTWQNQQSSKEGRPSGNFVNSHPRATKSDPKYQGLPNLQFPHNLGGGKLKQARNTAFAFSSFRFFFVGFLPKTVSSFEWPLVLLSLSLSLSLSPPYIPTTLSHSQIFTSFAPFYIYQCPRPSLSFSLGHTLNLMRFIRLGGLRKITEKKLVNLGFVRFWLLGVR